MYSKLPLYAIEYIIIYNVIKNNSFLLYESYITKVLLKCNGHFKGRDGTDTDVCMCNNCDRKEENVLAHLVIQLLLMTEVSV